MKVLSKPGNLVALVTDVMVALVSQHPDLIQIILLLSSHPSCASRSLTQHTQIHTQDVFYYLFSTNLALTLLLNFVQSGQFFRNLGMKLTPPLALIVGIFVSGQAREHKRF